MKESNQTTNSFLCKKVACANNACAMNNTAVAMLLHDGEYRRAANILKASLHIMQVVHDLSTTEDTIEKLEHCTHQQAIKASASLSNMSNTSQNSANMSNQMNSFRVTAVESNDFRSLKKAATAIGSSASEFYSILIREQNRPQNILDYHSQNSAIILYNFGLACHLASSNVLQEERSSLGTVIQQALALSHGTFSSLLEKCQNNVMNDIELVLLSLVVFSGSCRVFWERQLPNEAYEAQQAVTFLHNWMQGDFRVDAVMAYDDDFSASAA